MNDWRKKIYDVLEPGIREGSLSRVYDIFMIVVIILCTIPLMVRETNAVFDVFDGIAVTVFSIDYILRLVTADYYFKDHRLRSFLRYPVSPLAIIDLLSILPFISPLHNGFRALRLLRLIIALRVIALLRYSKSVQILKRVFQRQKEALLAVFGFTLAYILITAIIMFQIEPDTFGNFLNAFYWATVSLATVGYGDITAVSSMGRLFTILSTFVGIAVIALPAGVVTAGYLEEIRILNEEQKVRKEKSED
ncbi:MAG: ion transporter [Clostridiales bacterium]|nr:ion transporter [Clostridiales bacterium]